jgi:hypothetical protein
MLIAPPRTLKHLLYHHLTALLRTLNRQRTTFNITLPLNLIRRRILTIGLPEILRTGCWDDGVLALDIGRGGLKGTVHGQGVELVMGSHG